jgi:hypothetical protein
MDRRGFVARTLGALAVAPAFASLAACPRERAELSDPGVPRRMDLREHIPPHFDSIEVLQDGERLVDVIAYDLDHDTVTRILPRQRGVEGYTQIQYRTLHGGVVVRWLR